MVVCYFTLGYTSTSLSVVSPHGCSFVDPGLLRRRLTDHVQNIGAIYRTEYFGNILRNPIRFYDREENSSGSLLSRLSTDPKQVQDLIGVNGVFPLISIFNMIGCIAIAFSFGWKLALVTTFAAMPFMFAAAWFRIRYELQFEAMNAEVYAGSSQFATEAIGAFRTVTSLTMEDHIITKYSKMLREQRKKAFRKAWYATLVFAFSDSIELCAMALTFWYDFLGFSRCCTSPSNVGLMLMIVGTVVNLWRHASTTPSTSLSFTWPSSREAKPLVNSLVSAPTLRRLPLRRIAY